MLARHTSPVYSVGMATTKSYPHSPLTPVSVGMLVRHATAEILRARDMQAMLDYQLARNATLAYEPVYDGIIEWAVLTNMDTAGRMPLLRVP
jgi:hypothetical protein